LIAGGDDDEEKERKGIQTYHRQGQLNFTGLKRLLSGQDATARDGDLFVDLKYWGFMGMMLLAKASQYKETTRQDIKKENSVMDMINMFPAAVKTGLTEGVFGGTGTLLSALSMGGGYTDRWLLGMANVMENSFSPAWLAAFSRASDDYLRDPKDITLSKTAFNQIKQRFFSGSDLPPRRNIWGDKIEITPNEQNAYVYYMFGINKKNILKTDKFGYGLYDLYESTKDHNIFPPVLERELNGHDLTPKQYDDLQILVGSHRKQLTEQFINSGGIENRDNIEGISKELGRLYEQGRDIGVHEFLNLYPDLQAKKKK
jgi:hypothetical protein